MLRNIGFEQRVNRNDRDKITYNFIEVSNEVFIIIIVESKNTVKTQNKFIIIFSIYIIIISHILNLKMKWETC